MQPLRRIPLSGTENTRDLGGHPLPDGKMTAFGHFLRSGVPKELSPQDEALLLEMGITTIIDLRSEEELVRTPCHFADNSGFSYHHFPLSGGDVMLEGEDRIPYSYLEMTKCANAKNVFQAIANSSGGCLYHCTAGKDRTGTVSAILLLLAGAAEEDIVADYMITSIYLERLLKELSGMPDLPAYLGRSQPAYMQAFLNFFATEYRTAKQYLQGIGLSPAEISQIKEKLIC